MCLCVPLTKQRRHVLFHLKGLRRLARLQAQSDGTGSTIFPHLSLTECIERLLILFFHIHVWRQNRFCAVRGYLTENAWLGNALLMVFESELEDESLSLLFLFFWFRFFWAGHQKKAHTFQIKLLGWKLWISWTFEMQCFIWRWFVCLSAAQMIYSSNWCYMVNWDGSG